jgi:RNA polymerase sigma-70 factor (ECF subfamily)
MAQRYDRRGKKESPDVARAAENSTNPPDDFELMQRIADGDADALTTLYDRHSALVYAVGLRILGDRGAAEELLIDVFWEIWSRSDRYDRNRGAAVTYLLTLARSRAIDRRRSTAHQDKTQSNFSDGPIGTMAARTANPSDQAMSDERSELVRTALQSLEPDQRQAVEMSFFDGLSHTQIAARLAKPLGTVKTYIRQGLIRLRDSLRKHQ